MEKREQSRNKKFILSIIALVVIGIAVFGVTYAFFNYTKTGGANTIKTGRIYFTTAYTEINLTNAFPIDSQSASEANNPNVGIINISVIGDTDYSEGMEYLVTATDVHMTIGEGQSVRTVPLALEVGVTNNTSNNPATTLGVTETGDYYTLRTGYKTGGVSKYKVEYDGNLDEGDRILVGYIAPNTTQGEEEGIDGIITIKAYFDASRIAITDTYNSSEPGTDEYGTTTNWVNNREVFTTSEWNSLHENNGQLSFKIKIEANEGIWVANPGSAPMVIDTSNESQSMVPTTTRTIAITPNGDGQVTCTSSNTSVATCEITDTAEEEPLNGDILGDVVATKYARIRAVGAGSAVITIRQAAGREYATEKVLTYNVTVEKLSTTMSLSSNSGTITEGESDTVTITTNGDGALSCTSSTAHATCSITGTTLTINGVSAGSATITVSQTSGTTHLAATDVTYTATIEPAGITITYNANGGSVSTPSKLIAMDATTYGELIEATPTSGNLFTGWYDAASGGNPITSITAFTNGTSPTTLYAHYASSSGIKCKRVFDAHYLHTETCQQSSSYYYCSGDRYTQGATITYGNAKANGTLLVTGDAFDCKVTTNGGYTERFYYVSDRWTPGTDRTDSAFDNQTAVLIYYKNFKDGAPSDLGVAYNSNNINYNGPVTAVTHLPTTSTWSNISLNSTSRMIYACDNGNCSYTPSLYTNNGNNEITPKPYSYTGYAARLLTVPELKKGCTSISGKTTITSIGYLKACNFVFERTQYANTDTTTYPTYGPWLETPYASDSYSAWSADGFNRFVGIGDASNTNAGARPAIEVSKSNILY